MEDGALLAVLFAFLAVFAVLLVIAIIMYVLAGIGLFKIAKREGRDDMAWLAWIPVGNIFLLMVLMENDVHKEIRGKLTLIYGIALVASFTISFLISQIAIVPSLLYFYAFYFLAKRYSSNPILHLVIGIITAGISTAVSIFIFRNRDLLHPNGNGVAAIDAGDL